MKSLPFILLLLLSSEAQVPDPGDLIFSEVMQNPDAVTDGEGEWFEVYNTTGSDIEMQNLTITDQGIDSFTITSSVVVPAGGFVVFGRNGNTSTNGGVNIDYVYSGVNLANGDDELILKTPNDTIIDQIAWDNGLTFPDPVGASMNLNPENFTSADNDIGTNWCESTLPFGLGDLGTPGIANVNCMDAKLVFIAKDSYTGDLVSAANSLGNGTSYTAADGLIAGDALCQSDADAAGLPGKYMAWLSDTTESPSTRFEQATTPYVMPNGSIIASNWTDLVDGSIVEGIDRQADGSISGGHPAWTGTETDGTPSTQNCNGWASAASTDSGAYGVSSAVDSYWTRFNQFWGCNTDSNSGNTTWGLYCFQQ